LVQLAEAYTTLANGLKKRPNRRKLTIIKPPDWQREKTKSLRDLRNAPDASGHVPAGLGDRGMRMPDWLALNMGLAVVFASPMRRAACLADRVFQLS